MKPIPVAVINTSKIVTDAELAVDHWRRHGHFRSQRLSQCRSCRGSISRHKRRDPLWQGLRKYVDELPRGHVVLHGPAESGVVELWTMHTKLFISVAPQGLCTIKSTSGSRKWRAWARAALP